MKRGDDQMFLLVGAMLMATVGLCAVQLSRRHQAADLGWMSEQWLAEHRASPPL
jgi:hypothetical protein